MSVAEGTALVVAIILAAFAIPYSQYKGTGLILLFVAVGFLMGALFAENPELSPWLAIPIGLGAIFAIILLHAYIVHSGEKDLRRERALKSLYGNTRLDRIRAMRGIKKKKKGGSAKKS